MKFKNNLLKKFDEIDLTKYDFYCGILLNNK